MYCASKKCFIPIIYNVESEKMKIDFIFIMFLYLKETALN